MMSPRIRRTYIAALACLIAAVAHAEHPNPLLGAPVPTEVLSAKTVFLSNGGLDAGSMVSFAGSPTNVPFDRLYAALHSWGHYALVAAPAEADLVFEFRVDAALFSAGQGVASYSMFLTLSVLDPKTHFVLWTVKAPLQSRLEKSVNAGVAQLLNSLESLLAAGSAKAAT